MARRGAGNVKIYSHSRETLYERKGAVVTEIATKKKETHKSINLAKKFTRGIVDKNGLGSVVKTS